MAAEEENGQLGIISFRNALKDIRMDDNSASPFYLQKEFKINVDKADFDIKIEENTELYHLVGKDFKDGTKSTLTIDSSGVNILEMIIVAIHSSQPEKILFFRNPRDDDNIRFIREHESVCEAGKGFMDQNGHVKIHFQIQVMQGYTPLIFFDPKFRLELLWLYKGEINKSFSKVIWETTEDIKCKRSNVSVWAKYTKRADKEFSIDQSDFREHFLVEYYKKTPLFLDILISGYLFIIENDVVLREICHLVIAEGDTFRLTSDATKVLGKELIN